MTPPPPGTVTGGRLAALPQREPSPRPPRLRVVTAATAAPGRRRRVLLLGAATTVAVCVGLFAVVFFHVLLTEGQVQLDRLQARAEAEQARQERLRLQVAELESPQRVFDAATRLGMVRPATVTYLSPVPASGLHAPPAAPAPRR